MTQIEKQRLDKVEEKLETLEKKVDQVLGALIGSDLTVDGGLVQQFADHKEKVKALEDFKKKIWWLWIGAAIGGGLGFTKIVEWLELIK